MTVGDETIRGDGINQTALRDPLIGAVLDGYQVHSVVGSGAMGIVYRGMHQVIGKPVAIKVLKPDVADDPDMVDRLIREARTVNAIHHPGIVSIFGFGQMPVTRQPFIVMDLLEGEPLDVYVKREAPVPLLTAGPILDDLLSALAAAHAVGVIHRDLKPPNVFLEKQPEGRPRLKLLDFGLARQADRAGGSISPTNPGTLLGTPAFMAPEQVLGEKVSPATDLYAVGGIAYLLLTGHLPHEAPTAIEVITQKMKFDPIDAIKWQSDIGPAVNAWVMSFLHRDMDRRETSAESARRTLRRLLEPAAAPTVPGLPILPVKVKRTSGSNKHLPRAGMVPNRKWQDVKTVLVEAVSRDDEVSHSGPVPVLQPLPGMVEPTDIAADSPFSARSAELPTRADLPEAAQNDDSTQPPLAGPSPPRPWELEANASQVNLSAPVADDYTPKKSLTPLIVVLGLLATAVAVGAFLLSRT